MTWVPEGMLQRVPMATQNSPPTPPRRPTRAPKKLQPQLLAIEGIAAARRQILARRATAGSGDVIQADVDLVATALVAARERPYPQAIVAITGGSLSTVTPLFHDWFMRLPIVTPIQRPCPWTRQQGSPCSSNTWSRNS